MISIDTNVLLRYLLQDDQNQSPRANRLFGGKKKILITDMVLVEALWTLKGQQYNHGQQEPKEIGAISGCQTGYDAFSG